MRMLFCSLLLVMAPTVISAQNTSELFIRIDKSITEKPRPNWTLVKRRVYPRINQVLYEWRQSKSFVAVHVFIYNSPEEASTRFRALPMLLKTGGTDTGGIDMVVLQAKVPGLADENFLWEGSYIKRLFGVDFRSRRVLVHTSASSISAAEQFALQISEIISSIMQSSLMSPADRNASLAQMKAKGYERSTIAHKTTKRKLLQ